MVVVGLRTRNARVSPVFFTPRFAQSNSSFDCTDCKYNWICKLLSFFLFFFNGDLDFYQKYHTEQVFYIHFLFCTYLIHFWFVKQCKSLNIFYLAIYFRFGVEKTDDGFGKYITTVYAFFCFSNTTFRWCKNVFKSFIRQQFKVVIFPFPFLYIGSI